MCLHKKHILPKISWKPITVYKVLFKEIGGDSLYTPYQDYKVLSTIIKARYLSIFELTLEDNINGCGVHAYRDLVAAKEIKEKWFPRVIGNKRCAVAIYECTIPPFTFYWEGKDKDIAARKIKIGEKICRQIIQAPENLVDLPLLSRNIPILSALFHIILL